MIDIAVIAGITAGNCLLYGAVILYLDGKKRRREALRAQSEAILEETPTRLWHA